GRRRAPALDAGPRAARSAPGRLAGAHRPARPRRRTALRGKPAREGRAAAHPAGRRRRRGRRCHRCHRAGGAVPRRRRAMSSVPRGRFRAVLALAWLALLGVGGWLLSGHLRLEEDLRRFLPTPRTPAQVLLVDELGEGPGARLLLLALSGASPEALAARSQALRAALADRPEIALAANGGDAGLDAVPAHLLPYRYLLSPTLDEHALDADYLRAEL